MEPKAKILLVGSHATLMGAIAARLEYEHHCTVVGVVTGIFSPLRGPQPIVRWLFGVLLIATARETGPSN